MKEKLKMECIKKIIFLVIGLMFCSRHNAVNLKENIHNCMELIIGRYEQVVVVLVSYKLVVLLGCAACCLFVFLKKIRDIKLSTEQAIKEQRKKLYGFDPGEKLPVKIEVKSDHENEICLCYNDGLGDMEQEKKIFKDSIIMELYRWKKVLDYICDQWIGKLTNNLLQRHINCVSEKIPITILKQYDLCEKSMLDKELRKSFNMIYAFSKLFYIINGSCELFYAKIKNLQFIDMNVGDDLEVDGVRIKDLIKNDSGYLLHSNVNYLDFYTLDEPYGNNSEEKLKNYKTVLNDLNSKLKFEDINIQSYEKKRFNLFERFLTNKFSCVVQPWYQLINNDTLMKSFKLDSFIDKKMKDAFSPSEIVSLKESINDCQKLQSTYNVINQKIKECEKISKEISEKISKEIS